MKVSLNFYSLYWLRRSALAFGTGILIDFIFIRFFAKPYPEETAISMLLFPPILTLFYQFRIIQFFAGKLRGKFEYSFLFHERKKEILKVLKKLANDTRLFGLFSPFNPYSAEDIYNLTKQQVSEKTATPDNQFLFLVYHSIRAFKEYDSKKMILSLQNALSIKPKDLVTNYMLGQAYEMAGMPSESIAAYNNCLPVAETISINLSKFISVQIERVLIKGPKKTIHPASAFWQY